MGAGQGRYLTRAQAQLSLDTYVGAIAALNRRLSEKLPPPPGLEARGFVEREFLPDATHIPTDELRAFYDDLGDRLARLRRSDIAAQRAWRPSQAQ